MYRVRHFLSVKKILFNKEFTWLEAEILESWWRGAGQHRTQSSILQQLTTTLKFLYITVFYLQAGDLLSLLEMLWVCIIPFFIDGSYIFQVLASSSSVSVDKCRFPLVTMSSIVGPNKRHHKKTVYTSASQHAALTLRSPLVVNKKSHYFLWH